MKISDLLGSVGAEGSMLNVQNLNVIVAPEDKKDLDGQVIVVPTDGGGGSNKDVINPGIEYGENGQAKWAPPLQQQLSVIKGAVGTTTDDPTIEPTDAEKDAIVSARNDTGSNSNSAVAAVTDAIDNNNTQETTPEKDILARIKELAAIAIKKANPSSTQDAATFLTRNFPS